MSRFFASWTRNWTSHRGAELNRCTRGRASAHGRLHRIEKHVAQLLWIIWGFYLWAWEEGGCSSGAGTRVGSYSNWQVCCCNLGTICSVLMSQPMILSLCMVSQVVSHTMRSTGVFLWQVVWRTICLTMLLNIGLSQSCLFLLLPRTTWPQIPHRNGVSVSTYLEGFFQKSCPVWCQVTVLSLC